MLLEVENITQAYDDAPVLRSVSMSTAHGEIACLLGPSGCGKSTLLRVIAGLEPAYSGTVRFSGQPVDRVPPHRRGFGLMFQDWALFPHLSVAQNIAFGLRMQRLPRREIEQRVSAILDLVGLPGYGERTIFELSGGERQRVALARALAPQPRLLMLDEPLGALDRTLRERLTEELRTIIKRVGLTSIYVTHDQAEAFTVADRILLMNRGKIVQDGRPADVYRHPCSPFVARFLGLTNLIRCDRIDASDGTPIAHTPLGPLLVGDAPTSALHVAPPQRQFVLVRPEAAEVVQPGSINTVAGDVVRSTFRGGTERVVVRHASGIMLELDMETGGRQPWSERSPEGERVEISLRADAVTLVPDDRGMND